MPLQAKRSSRRGLQISLNHRVWAPILHLGPWLLGDRVYEWACPVGHCVELGASLAHANMTCLFARSTPIFSCQRQLKLVDQLDASCGHKIQKDETGTGFNAGSSRWLADLKK